MGVDQCSVSQCGSAFASRDLSVACVDGVLFSGMTVNMSSVI